METDPLQQLRDVHLPGDPSWWPPAIGWWIVAIAILLALYWLALRALNAYRARLPLKQARTLQASYFADWQAGRMTHTDFAHATNALIKRLLVRAQNRMDYARLTGERWLQELDMLSNSRQFTEGPGRVLGTERFAASADIDGEGLHRAVEKLFSAINSPVINHD